MQATRVHKSLITSQKRINAFRGGARSSKTWSICQVIAIWLVSGKIGEKEYKTGSFSVIRQTLPVLKKSVYKDFIEILHQIGKYRIVNHSKTALEFTYRGREVRFFSADDQNSEKLRGLQHTFFYMNEANSVSFDAFNQLLMRTEQFCILDYNPAGIANWCKTHIEEDRLERGEVKLDVSTYKDNPFLPKAMVNEIENLYHTDRDLWEVYTLGNWVNPRNLVFQNVTLISSMPYEYDKEFFGIDFGYIDPAVIVRVLVKGDNIYIQEILYRPGIEDMHEIASIIQLQGIGKIYADHEPRTIQQLRRYGVRIKKAKKGKDSIRQGLGFIRQHKIHILETSENVVREFRTYRYKEDGEGVVLDEPEDKDNHAPDAVRYALSYAERKEIKIR